jgi:hypothetical protein
MPTHELRKHSSFPYTFWAFNGRDIHCLIKKRSQAIDNVLSSELRRGSGWKIRTQGWKVDNGQDRIISFIIGLDWRHSSSDLLLRE